MGWFFGFKLHLVIDLNGNIVSACISGGNCDDRSPVEKLLQGFRGVVFGDKGYISQNLFTRLWKKGIKLVTGLKMNMKNMLLNYKENLLLRKRSLIESVFSCLKRNLLEHSRHRSPVSFCVHLFTTLIAYQLSPHKPSISKTLPLDS